MGTLTGFEDSFDSTEIVNWNPFINQQDSVTGKPRNCLSLLILFKLLFLVIINTLNTQIENLSIEN